MVASCGFVLYIARIPHYHVAKAHPIATRAMMEDVMVDNTLRQLGPYRLIERIGHGGMCEVYLAEVYGASGFSKRVAIKVLLPEYRGEAIHERSMIKEATLGAGLQHRNLVQVHDFGVDRGLHYMRIDYVEGRDLRALRGNETIDEPLAILIAAEIATALHYLHTHADTQGRPLGLVHRDVTPSNILLSVDGEVKLADFGVMKATHLATDTRGNIRKGKYAYMSPEQVRNQNITAASDQFGLGIVLMEMLCGRRPYDGAHAMETMEQIEATAPPDLDGLSDDLREIIATCLAPLPRDRFEDTATLCERLLEASRSRALASPSKLSAWVKDRK